MKTKDENIKLNGIPAFTMNTTDKLFFALARRDVDTLSYVYALVVNKADNGYPVEMQTEISAFKNAQRANIYYETAKLVMEQQKTGILKQLHDTYSRLFDSQITAFNTMASSFQIKTK